LKKLAKIDWRSEQFWDAPDYTTNDPNIDDVVVYSTRPGGKVLMVLEDVTEPLTIDMFEFI
jgi:hypothetical protein